MSVIAASDLQGCTLHVKQLKLLPLLRRMGDCAWPTETGFEVIEKAGGRTTLTVAQAVARINAAAPQVDKPVPHNEGLDMARGTLRVDDPISSFCYEGAPRGKRRIE